MSNFNFITQLYNASCMPPYSEEVSSLFIESLPLSRGDCLPLAHVSFQLNLTEPENLILLTAREVTTFDETFVPVPAGVVESPTNFSGTEPEKLIELTAQEIITLDKNFAPIFVADENSYKLTESEQRVILLKGLMSEHLKGNTNFLCLSKNLREYFLRYRKFIVTLNYDNLRTYPFHEAISIIRGLADDLIQKTGMGLKIDDMRSLELVDFAIKNNGCCLKNKNILEKIVLLDILNVYATEINHTKIIEFISNFKLLAVLLLGDIPKRGLYFTIVLSEDLKALKILSVKDVEEGAAFTIRGNLPALETLSFSNISSMAQITLQVDLPALETLSFGHIDERATIQIPPGLKRAVRNLTPELEASIYWV